MKTYRKIIGILLIITILSSYSAVVFASGGKETLDQDLKESKLDEIDKKLEDAKKVDEFPLSNSMGNEFVVKRYKTEEKHLIYFSGNMRAEETSVTYIDLVCYASLLEDEGTKTTTKSHSVGYVSEMTLKWIDTAVGITTYRHMTNVSGNGYATDGSIYIYDHNVEITQSGITEQPSSTTVWGITQYPTNTSWSYSINFPAIDTNAGLYAQGAIWSFTFRRQGGTVNYPSSHSMNP